ncbi:MAG TPA: ATP-binding protein, partial [Armatimonadota bacterium]|nr:ATP-binding protein [Armatimonadota bacterium]
MSCFHGSIGSSELVDKVRQTIQESQMLPIPAKVVVAVSGGADSVALLHALWVLRNELYLSLIVAHLNHGLRGEEADKDAVFVEDLAARLNLPAVVEKVNVRKI